MIVVTIREGTAAAARQRMAAVGRGAGMLELRLDDMAGEAWEDCVAHAPLPVLVTCRGRRHRGGFPGSEEERVAVLRRAAAAGASRVDVELGSAAEDLCRELPPEQVVLSVHLWRPGLAGVEAQFRRLLAHGKRSTVKLAFAAERASHALEARRLLREAARDGRQAVVIPMGQVAVAGRILAPAWGAAWTYACADGAPPAADGQLPLQCMAGLYDVDRIRQDEPLTGLLGWPVDASLSPWMHNRALRRAGLPGRYLPFPEEDAADVVLNAEAWGLKGLSVTHPHKEAVLPWVEHLSVAARACGAVNTLTFSAAGIQGDNTDAAAAVEALQEVVPAGWTWQGRSVAIAGAGGGARAVAWALIGAGAQVTFYSRDEQQGAAAAARLGGAAQPLAALPVAQADVLVQATPVGGFPHTRACLSEALATPAQIVFDLVSNPQQTALLAHAEARGSAVQSGLRMLVRQGEAQFRQWHQRQPEPGCFEAAALEGLRLWGAR